MKNYTTANIKNKTQIIVINDYETSITELIKILDFYNIEHVIFDISYLSDTNNFKYVSFKVENDHIIPNSYKYLNKNEIIELKTHLQELKTKKNDININYHKSHDKYICN